MKVLWGTPNGAKSWEEEVLIETTDEVELQKAKESAKENGYTNLRVLNTHTGDKPDFIGTFKI